MVGLFSLFVVTVVLVVVEAMFEVDVETDDVVLGLTETSEQP